MRAVEACSTTLFVVRKHTLFFQTFDTQKMGVRYLLMRWLMSNPSAYHLGLIGLKQEEDF